MEVLVLRNLGLSSLGDKLKLPNLRYLDVSHNHLADLKAFLDFLARSPKLEVLSMNNNPISLLPDVLDKVTLAFA